MNTKKQGILCWQNYYIPIKTIEVTYKLSWKEILKFKIKIEKLLARIFP